MTINIDFKTKEITYDKADCIRHISRIIDNHWHIDWKFKLTE